MIQASIRTLIAASVLANAPALAADMRVKAPIAPAAPIWSWTGFYGGVSIGARWAENDWTSTDFFPAVGGITVQPVTGGPVDSVAARVGGYFGYNWQIAPAWIVGVEGDGGWANNAKTVAPIPGSAGIVGPGCGGGVCTGPTTATVKESWDGSLRGRIGMLVTPSTLVFATGGAAWQRITLEATCAPSGLPTTFCLINTSGSASTTLTGWTLGGGLEQRISGNWLGRMSYRYSDFGTFSHQFFTVPAPSCTARTMSVPRGTAACEPVVSGEIAS